MRKHYLEQYLAQAQHKITIDLIGCGGTGSHMLSNLAMISKSMVGLGRQPFFVRVFDPDIVEDHNIGRQMFSPADVGQYKSDIMVSRINRFYGLDWHSIPERYGDISNNVRKVANITVSCVDSVISRKLIYGTLENAKKQRGQSYDRPYYWLDTGNGKNSAQIILSTIKKINQPSTYTRANLPTFFDEFPDAVDDKDEPSCSMAEALGKQDLFINKMVATHASQMLWDLLKNYFIGYRMIYMNMAEKKLSMVSL